MLTVYNYLTRRQEPFKSIEEGFVSFYVCGPTVYEHAHIGHAKVYVSFDVMVRYLRYLGYQVRYVHNITDVGHLSDDADEGEDKILRRAVRDRVEPMELVETYMHSFFEDMDALNVLRPNISPRPSGHIPEQIELIKLSAGTRPCLRGQRLGLFRRDNLAGIWQAVGPQGGRAGRGGAAGDQP